MLFGTDSMYDALSLIQLFKYGCRICHIKLQLTALVTSGCSVLLIVSEGCVWNPPALRSLCSAVPFRCSRSAGVMALVRLLP